MTNEIKEILDYLGNDKNYNCDCNDGSYYLELPYREAHELKDCITNLQEENEKNKTYSEFYKDMSDKWKNMSDVFKKSCNDYKSRNKKAIEFLEHFDSGQQCEHTKDLAIIIENILQGEDKE